MLQNVADQDRVTHADRVNQIEPRRILEGIEGDLALGRHPAGDAKPAQPDRENEFEQEAEEEPRIVEVNAILTNAQKEEAAVLIDIQDF